MSDTTTQKPTQYQSRNNRGAPIQKLDGREQAMKRPNFFLALRLHNCKETAQAVHRVLCEYDGYDDKRLNTFREKMHITLFVLRLNTTEDIQKVVDALSSAKALYTKYWSIDASSESASDNSEAKANPKHTMRLKGLGHFGDPTTKRFVLWSGLDSSTQEGQQFVDHLTQFVRELHAHIESLHPTLLTESIARFNPHATLYKTRFEKGRRSAHRSTRKVLDNQQLEALKLKFADHELASQPVVDIQLLDMQRVDPDGFYRCFAKQSLATPFNMNWIVKAAPRLDREWREYQARLKGEPVPERTGDDCSDEESKDTED